MSCKNHTPLIAIVFCTGGHRPFTRCGWQRVVFVRYLIHATSRKQSMSDFVSVLYIYIYKKMLTKWKKNILDVVCLNCFVFKRWLRISQPAAILRDAAAFTMCRHHLTTSSRNYFCLLGEEFKWRIWASVRRCCPRKNARRAVKTNAKNRCAHPTETCTGQYNDSYYIQCVVTTHIHTIERIAHNIVI